LVVTTSQPQSITELFIYLFFIYLTLFVNKTAAIHNKTHNIYQREKMIKPKGLKHAAAGNLKGN